MREQCMNSDKQCVNSDPCEVTIHAQKKKKKKMWKEKRSINLNPNTHNKEVVEELKVLLD